ADATLANAFVVRWCVGSKAEAAGGVFLVREDEPAPRTEAALHRTPLRSDATLGRDTDFWGNAIRGGGPIWQLVILGMQLEWSSWNGGPRRIIVQQRHEHEGCWRKPRRAG